VAAASDRAVPVVRAERSDPERSDQSDHQIKELVVRKTFNGRMRPLNAHHYA
jgi:hypothetical protein